MRTRITIELERADRAWTVTIETPSFEGPTYKTHQAEFWSEGATGAAGREMDNRNCLAALIAAERYANGAKTMARACGIVVEDNLGGFLKRVRIAREIDGAEES